MTRNESGFTLVEFIVAMLIFSIGVMAGVVLLGAGYRYQGQARLATEMTVLAEMKVEELRSVAGTELADTVQLTFGGDTETNVPDHWDNAQLDGRTFTRRWRVEAGPAGVRRVTVRVQPANPPAAGRADLATNIIHD